MLVSIECYFFYNVLFFLEKKIKKHFVSNDCLPLCTNVYIYLCYNPSILKVKCIDKIYCDSDWLEIICVVKPYSHFVVLFESEVLSFYRKRWSFLLCFVLFFVFTLPIGYTVSFGPSNIKKTKPYLLTLSALSIIS